MHLICINHNNIIKKTIFRQKKVVAVLFTCVLTSMQTFAAIGPFGAEIWRGGQIDPPPSKNLLSKSPVKIGLKNKIYQKKVFLVFNSVCIIAQSKCERRNVITMSHSVSLKRNKLNLILQILVQGFQSYDHLMSWKLFVSAHLRLIFRSEDILNSFETPVSLSILCRVYQLFNMSLLQRQWNMMIYTSDSLW